MSEKDSITKRNVATINLQLVQRVNYSFSYGVGPLMWDHWTVQGSQLTENYSSVKFSSSQKVFQEYKRIKLNW
jgi:hypothetical protein